jgi:hypothetical protein
MFRKPLVNLGTRQQLGLDNTGEEPKLVASPLGYLKKLGYKIKLISNNKSSKKKQVKSSKTTEYQKLLHEQWATNLTQKLAENLARNVRDENRKPPYPEIPEEIYRLPDGV